MIALATQEPEFLVSLRSAPVRTLSAYGLVLREPEMDELFAYLIANAGLSDADIISDLTDTELARW